jgi:hypothetical protein
MQTRHHTKRRLASALAAIAIMATAMPAAAVFDQGSARLAQEKISVVQAADNIVPRPMSASVNRDPMINHEDMAATLREALPESPRLEFFALVFGMLFVPVGGLLAIYFVDRKNVRHNQ